MLHQLTRSRELESVRQPRLSQRLAGRECELSLEALHSLRRELPVVENQVIES